MSPFIFIFILLLTIILAKPTVRLESAGGTLISFSVSSQEDMDLLTWGTPFEGIVSNMFDVIKISATQTLPVPYLGRLYKRGNPIPSDYIKLHRNIALSVTFDISEFYEFKQVGEHRVQLRLPSYSADSFEILKRFVNVNISMNHLSRQPRIDDNQDECTEPQANDVNQAVHATLPVVTRSYTCLKQGSCNTNAVTWFGNHSETNYNYVKNTVFLAIEKHMQVTPFKAVCYPKGCPSNVYAYVFPADKNFTVYLCNLFFTIPNERIETIVHELSHFVSLGNTDDVAYGRARCLNLALTNPTRASHNADNICYFASDFQLNTAN